MKNKISDAVWVFIAILLFLLYSVMSCIGTSNHKKPTKAAAMDHTRTDLEARFSEFPTCKEFNAPIIIGGVTFTPRRIRHREGNRSHYLYDSAEGKKWIPSDVVIAATQVASE